ncbi:MAG: cupin domain-containing protein [Betaproteobacteria bacterium]|nr:MAG: cupin domain-containing protein [Betaproteobacteria bacterium]
MLKDRRRVVTGHNESGKSIVVIDGPPARIFGTDTRGLAEVWNTDGAPINTQERTDSADIDVVLSPVAHGSKFRFFAIAPEDLSLSDEEREARVAARFAAMGAAHERPDTSRHPAMHKTKTVDYIILLSGEATLLLDDDERDLKPFDVVVQRGTNHAWINKGTEPALLAGVLVDADVE